MIDSSSLILTASVMVPVVALGSLGVVFAGGPLMSDSGQTEKPHTENFWAAAPQ